MIRRRLLGRAAVSSAVTAVHHASVVPPGELVPSPDSPQQVMQAVTTISSGFLPFNPRIGLTQRHTFPVPDLYQGGGNRFVINASAMFLPGGQLNTSLAHGGDLWGYGDIIRRLAKQGLRGHAVVELSPAWSDEALARYLAAIINEYQPKSILLGNELNISDFPLERYVEQVFVADQVRTSIQPVLRLLPYGYAFTSSTQEFTDLLGRVNARSPQRFPFDAYAIHYYGDVTNLSEYISRFASITAKLNRRRPIFMTEVNLDVDDSLSREEELPFDRTLLTQEEQASYLFQLFGTALAGGVAKVFLHSARDFGDTAGSLQRFYGEFRLPGLTGYLLAERLLNHLERIDAPRIEKGCTIVAMERWDGWYVVLAWNNERDVTHRLRYWSESPLVALTPDRKSRLYPGQAVSTMLLEPPTVASVGGSCRILVSDAPISVAIE